MFNVHCVVRVKYDRIGMICALFDAVVSELRTYSLMFWLWITCNKAYRKDFVFNIIIKAKIMTIPLTRLFLIAPI